MQKIPLGSYDVGEGKRIQAEFAKTRNKNKQRSPNRIKGHIAMYGRGYRYGKKNYSYSQDLPIEKAQRVALYLVIK